jgi:hypothetical protein
VGEVGVVSSWLDLERESWSEGCVAALCMAEEEAIRQHGIGGK